MAENDAVNRDGWHLVGEEQEAVKTEVVEAYTKGRVNGIDEVFERCDKWQIYPIYKLPPQGRWHKGRVLLLGDAAHAVCRLFPQCALLYVFLNSPVSQTF